MNVFYLPDATEGMVSFSEEESKHCVKVLRMQEGDRFCVTDGKGSLYDGELAEAHPKRAVACLSNRRPGYDNRTFTLEIAIAPTKLNERTEWFLEKATEIGIDRVRLFASYHSERRVANVERFRKVMIAAMKQSIKSRLPEIEDVVDFNKLVKQPFDGPEGDFSPEEAKLAMDNGFIPVSLGEARLRTETAAVVACHTIQLLNQMKRT